MGSTPASTLLRHGPTHRHPRSGGRGDRPRQGCRRPARCRRHPNCCARHPGLDRPGPSRQVGGDQGAAAGRRAGHRRAAAHQGHATERGGDERSNLAVAGYRRAGMGTGGRRRAGAGQWIPCRPVRGAAAATAGREPGRGMTVPPPDPPNALPPPASAGSDRPPAETRAAPVRIGPVGRAPTERWLRTNGLPACAAVILGLALDLVLVTDLSFGTGAAFIGGAVIVAVVGAYLMTAVGIPEMAVFTVGWFARTVWRSGSGMMHVLPLLLVAVTFFFLTGETWMSIGRLSGLPLVLTMVLVGTVAVLALLRKDGVDWHQHRIEPDAAWFRRLVPRQLMPAGPIRYADPVPTFGERLNLRLLSVLGRALVAAVVGLFVMVFFLLFGILTVDLSVAASWSAAVPNVWWDVTVA